MTLYRNILLIPDRSNNRNLITGQPIMPSRLMYGADLAITYDNTLAPRVIKDRSGDDVPRGLTWRELEKILKEAVGK